MLKSTVAIAIIAIAFFLLGAPSLSAQDVVLNGNFELQTIAPWVLYGGNLNTSLLPWDVDGIGGATMALERKPGLPDDNGGIKQDVLLINGVTYDFYADIQYYSCWASYNDGGNFAVTINGTLVASDSCGPITLNQTIIRQLAGTYTATMTGLHSLEIYNDRPGDIHQHLLENYIDDISLVPQTTDFSSDVIQFSASTANMATFSLDAGPSHAGEKYLVLLSTSGNYPGIINGGYWVPLNMDGVLMFSLQNANSAMLVHTKATLDAGGKATAALRTFNPMPTWIGKTVNVAYVLYNGPGVVPISYGSMPVSILFIP